MTGFSWYGRPGDRRTRILPPLVNLEPEGRETGLDEVFRPNPVLPDMAFEDWTDFGRSSSEFFFCIFSDVRDLMTGLVYKLEVDLALVNPLVAITLLSVNPDFSDSNNFLVCFTVSGAGSSLSLTPKRTPAEGGLGTGLVTLDEYLDLEKDGLG